MLHMASFDILSTSILTTKVQNTMSNTIVLSQIHSPMHELGSFFSFLFFEMYKLLSYFHMNEFIVP